MKLKDKIAVVTGGGSGIGLAAARLFAAEGAEVAILGRDRQKLADASAGAGGKPVALRCDVAQPIEIASAMRQIAERFGRIDVLFANAGASHCPDLPDTSEADFDAIFDINVKGVFFTFLHALPILSAGASVIFTGSVAARKGRPGDALYAASKGAVRSLARTLAVSDEALAKNIRVNVVTPGATRTPLTAAATESDEVREYVERMVPMHRWGDADEVARAALFLACADSSYVTGTEIVVDGGLAAS